MMKKKTAKPIIPPDQMRARRAVRKAKRAIHAVLLLKDTEKLAQMAAVLKEGMEQIGAILNQKSQLIREDQ